MEGEMVNQPTAEDRLIDRRSVLRAGAALAAAGPALLHGARAEAQPRPGEIFPREQQTPEALGAFQKAQIEKWWPIIKELGIKAE
jgi:hypothetical protein